MPEKSGAVDMRRVYPATPEMSSDDELQLNVRTVWLVVEASRGEVSMGTLEGVVSTMSDQVEAHAE